MKLVGIAFILFVGIMFAQSSIEKFTPQLDAVVSNSNQGEELLVWVFFSDKGENIQTYFNKPITVVSEKSLKRRAKVLSENELITVRDLPVNQNYIDQVNSLGLKLKQKTKWFNGVSGWATKSELAQFANLSCVKQLDIVHRFRKDMSEEDNASNSPEESNPQLSKPEVTNSYNYGQSFTQLNQITVPQVHDLGFTGTGVTICMMDAGFDQLSHQAFSSMNIIATWDFVNGDPDVENGNDMGNGAHGTSTLSITGGFYEGQLIGPAFDADFILAKTENTDSETPIEEDNWIAAMEWADSIGVDVTSTSLTYLDFDPPYPSYTWQDMDGNTALITNGADYAVYLGIFVANSAGNGGSVAPPENTLGAPADGDSVMAIGSVTSTGSRSSFSSVGPSSDGRIKPDLMAMGSSTYHACNSNNSCYSGFGGGTSYSCPLVAGAAALLLQVSPDLTPMQLASLLKNTASQSTNPDNLYGWGIINTYAAVQSLLTGVENTIETPDDYYILQNYPNPFNPSTKIRFAVPEKSNVKLALYDVLGRELDIFLDEEINPGIKEVELNASELSSGIYLVRMITNTYQKTIKISLLK